MWSAGAIFQAGRYGIGRMTSSDESSAIFRTATNTSLLDGLRDPTNRTVWQGFVERYRPLIERFALRRGFDEADAQDVAQQTLIAFCIAYQEGKYDRDKGRLRFWLFGIARNQIRTLRKRPRREVQTTDETSQTGLINRIPDDDSDMEKHWDEEWRAAVLRQCLDEVRREFDAKSIEAFELFAWKGLPAQQVGECLGLTPNAVFIVKHRIMKRIKELLPAMEEIW